MTLLNIIHAIRQVVQKFVIQIGSELTVKSIASQLTIRLAIITVTLQQVIRFVIHFGMDLTAPNIARKRMIHLDDIPVIRNLA
jgi:hypothetical protein